ncbi:protein furry-like isoform X6 [Penaeus japonicus]|uniref:protein furry-like isoform X6 n=1 Tax=Penaeus japonicus TaxID=27405 RepID=UPI001C71118F|nr:protein furry-like isoform X6 [Penaeus japonicus]
MADPDDPATDGGLAQAVNEEVIVSLPAVAAAVAAATTISTGTHSSTASQATIASTLSGSSTMNATPPPGSTDGDEVGERGPGDGREAGQEELLEINSDEENEQSSSTNDGTNSADPTSERSHTVVSDSSTDGSGGGGSGNAGGQASALLPWGARKERAQFPATVHVDTDLRPGEFVMRTLFAEFTVMADKKIEAVMQEPLERSLSKSLQRGEDPTFDQLLLAFGCVAEHCLPSLLRTLFSWYDRQGVEWGATDSKYKQDPSKSKGVDAGSNVDRETIQERRDLAVEFIFCLVLIEVLRQLAVHPGHDDLVRHIEDIAFKHFKYREGVQNNPNGANINTIADLYAEVIGVLAQSRFQSVRRRFMAELKELRAREQSSVTTQSITSLLMGMKFFRVKMVPIEEFEASFQFMQECAQYFLEVRDKDIKHALAGLFVEILVPVAATVKHEVNVPCLKYFVEMLYSTTLDMATRNKHRLPIFPLVTCLLCVSQKTFFLSNWHYFLAMCLQHLKNRDPKMSRVALESLYRLLWVYMIRIKCESNSATHSRLASIVNSLFPKGSKGVVPRDTPLNIFVKIIQFIAQERLDFAMREIVFDLLSVGRQIKIIMTPERMSIGLRAFLVVADSLQQKEGDPPMPRTVGVLPSGNTLRVKKTFLNKMLTEDTARNIGISAYYPLVRKSFNDILKALDSQFGRPLMMTNTQNVNKEPDEMITGERKPKIDLFRTCVAAVPRLIPDGMSGRDLVDMLSRLTVHMDEELRALAFQSLQSLVLDFPEWRHDVVYGFIQFIVKEVGDTSPQLLDNGVRMLLQLLTAWKNALTNTNTTSNANKRDPGVGDLHHLHLHQRGDHSDVLRLAEGFALVLLCSCRQAPRRVSVAIMREVKQLAKVLGEEDPVNHPVIDVMDKWCGCVVESVLTLLPAGERSAVAATTNIDLQWLADRSSSVWTGGFVEDSSVKSVSVQHLPCEDVWALVLCGFIHHGRVLSSSPQAISHAWPIVYTRANSLYSIVDPTPPNDNRASLLRSATQMKKPISERDVYMNLWRNYVVLACRVVPAITKTPFIRCASPDISLGSSPDSGAGGDRGSDRHNPGYSVSPLCLYKLLVPLLRYESTDMRDAVTLALGKINHIALSDLMEELLPYIRESIDRKQENMRRRKRRDALRVTLVKLFEMSAEQGTFALSESVIDGDTGALQKRYLEYMDGARLYLENENDKDNTLQQIKTHFCHFVRKLIGSFSLEQRQTLIPRALRKDLFYLFASWSGVFGAPFGFKSPDSGNRLPSEFELCALHASSAVLCCGPSFDPQLLADDGNIYQWLDALLGSHDEKIKSKIYALAQETIVLLLEFNPDSGAVLDWVVDRCYTATPEVADGCFNALATIFSAREYPCDHYTAIMNVTLLHTGCPRASIHETALQLLQVLDKRFFGAVTPLVGEAEERRESSTLDVLLSSTYSRSQLYLSKQLAHLHPELTMPMFSEISYRLQTARCAVRQLLLHYLLPWLYNMELVDPSTPPPTSAPYGQYYYERGRREGWGSAEATEMVLNNLFYITAKFGDDHPKEVEELWAALCTCWPNNLKVIIRYLFIITGMAAAELLPYAKRVIVYVGRARPDRLVEELMAEMGTVETLNCVIERTETPPFFRLTSMRKTSSHGEGGGVGGSGTPQEQDPSERGTLHTKRHSGDHHDLPRERYSPLVSREQRSAPGSLRSVSSIGSGVSSVIAVESSAAASTAATTAINMKSRPNSSLAPNSLTSNAQEDLIPTTVEVTVPQEDNFAVLRAQNSSINGGAPGVMVTGNVISGTEDASERYEPPQPHPLPMPEYGGYFAPLTEYLPDSSQPITAFHRCNLAVMLICDVIVAGIDVDCHSVDWSIHVPLMLHIITLGLDHSRPLVHQHCKILLVHLLTVVADHRDHLGVARVLLNNKTTQLGYGLIPYNIFTHNKNFTEEPPTDPTPPIVAAPPGFENPPDSMSDGGAPVGPPDDHATPVIITSDDNADTVSGSSAVGVDSVPQDDLQYSIMALIDFIASSKNQPLWTYEDITSKQFSIKSADQLTNYVRHVVTVFNNSLPHTHIEERWAQIALHLALSCSSRHYAGRSLQVFRSLHVSMSSRMLSDLLGRLVETVAEQGEDMQGYVTELMLTLESAVDALDSDFRPIEFVRELFKSTPNLNNKERKGPLGYGMMGHFYGTGYPPPSAPLSPGGHIRSTSYSISYGRGKPIASPTADIKVQPEMRGRSGTDVDSRMRQQQQQQLQQSSNLSRSRSAQSLKQLADQSSADDKMTVLAQLFWIAVSMLESDYEYEFILAMRLLDKVLTRLPLDRPDCRDKVEKLQQQLKWKEFPGVHALLLKGCTSATTYEPTITLLTRFTQLTDLQVVDPTQNRSFAINVIAMLPYMLQNYEDANTLCIQSAENIAQVCNKKGKQLENLATVMTLYSRRNFSKESFQWTKCVVKYLHDSYASLSLSLMAFLVEVLEKGPASVQNPILNILHCMLHYIDINTAAAQLVNGDLLRVIAKYIEGSHWKEALRILKMAVTRSSSLVVPPASSHTHYWDHHVFADIESHFKKELPGRTMEFTFDVSQTPVIGRRYLKGSGMVVLPGQISAGSSTVSSATSDSLQDREQERSVSDHAGVMGIDRAETSSPRRSLSLSAADTNNLAGWKRPWLSQARVRECLVNLLNTCGQRVGLPKSPSQDGNINKVIFSQSSELERQSSMASSTEEVSVAPGDTTNDRTADDMTSSEKQFAVFKDFDFLEYELESQGEESVDNFNLWGVRRRSPNNLGDGEPSSHIDDMQGSEMTPSHVKKPTPPTDHEWWEEEGSVSPVDDPALGPSERSAEPLIHHTQPAAAPHTAIAPKLTLDTIAARRPASPTSMSDHSESSDGDLGDMTPCNASPSIAAMLFRPIRQPNDLEDAWRAHLLSLMAADAPIPHPTRTCTLYNTVFSECVVKFTELVSESSHYLGENGEMIPVAASFLHHMETVGYLAPLAYVYVDATLLGGTQLMQRFRSTFIALHEHLDTYLDKRESAIVCLDGIKSTLKLQNLGESLPELCADEQHIDLCRCLYKLHFQLSLLYDTYAKFIVAMLHAARNSQASDHSVELSALQGKLTAAAEQIDATPPTTPTRSSHSLPPERELPEGEEGECESVGGEESEGGSACESSISRAEGGSPVSSSSLGSQSLELPVAPPGSRPEAELQLLQLVADQRWVDALQFVRQHRALWLREVSAHTNEDITIILNTYCTYLADKKPGMIAVCGTETELLETSSRLTEANMAALSALRAIEQTPKQARDSLESVIRKTEC